MDRNCPRGAKHVWLGGRTVTLHESRNLLRWELPAVGILIQPGAPCETSVFGLEQRRGEEFDSELVWFPCCGVSQPEEGAEMKGNPCPRSWGCIWHRGKSRVVFIVPAAWREGNKCCVFIRGRI